MIALNLQAEKESEMTLSLYTFLEYKFLKEAEQEADSLFHAKIRRSVGGMMLRGYVEDTDVGQRTGERLYRVRYEDGDLEHMTDVQMLQCVVLS